MGANSHIAGFLRIIDALCRVVAACGRRGAFGPPENGMATGVHLRLVRLAARFRSLASRYEAGALAPPRKRARNPGANGRMAVQVLPRRRGFVADGGHEIRGHAAQLAHFLNQPGTGTLIAADPRFGRILRPLCHMLRIPLPECLRLPRRPRKPRRCRLAPVMPESRPAVWHQPPDAGIARTLWRPGPSRRGRAPPSPA